MLTASDDDAALAPTELVAPSQQPDEQQPHHDEEEVKYLTENDGYILLPLDDGDEEDDNDNNETSTQDEDSSDTKPTLFNPKPLELDWNPSNDIPKDDMDLIRKTMQSIHIPEEAVPAWAREIPESAWMPVFKQRSDQPTTVDESLPLSEIPESLGLESCESDKPVDVVDAEL